MTFKNILIGTKFTVDVWDTDDNIMWALTYEKTNDNEYTYLGGGIDFGTAIGKKVTEKIILEEMEEHSLKIQGGVTGVDCD